MLRLLTPALPSLRTALRGPLGMGAAAPRAFSRSAVRRSGARAPKEAPKEAPGLNPDTAPKFEPDTPASRFLFRASLGGLALFVGYVGVNVYSGYYSTTAKREAEDTVKAIPLFKGNPVLYLDFTVDNEPLGRVVIQARKDLTPVAAENFRRLCTHEKGYGYAASRVHAVLPGQYVGFGDFQFGTGEGGRESAIGDGSPFPDENYKLKHVGPGVVSMFSPVPNENGSLAFICLGKAPIHDGRYQAFGNVLSGLEVVRALEQYGNWRGDVAANIRISACGELVLPPELEAEAEVAAQ